ncbi:MAG: alpha/beta fold hydrolase [Pseudomonadota bacterium]
MKPQSPPVCRPPSRLATLSELRAPLDAFTLLWQLPTLLHAPRGDGRPIVLAPGFRADESSMWPLKRFLRRIGYDAYDWSLGRNQGDVERQTAALCRRVDTLFDDCGQEPVTLIGWSLGGVVAREVARLRPETVREVITMGTPIIGGPKYTAVGARYARERGLEMDMFEAEVHERNSIGITQPVTSIYSKLDGVVGWEASVDVYNDQARNIPVLSSHFGLGVNATVWRRIADILAASE